MDAGPCPICLETYHHGDEIMVADCGHTMCLQCFDMFIAAAAHDETRPDIPTSTEVNTWPILPSSIPFHRIEELLNTIGTCPTCRSDVSTGQVVVVVQNGTEQDPIHIKDD